MSTKNAGDLCKWKHQDCPAWESGLCIAVTDTEFPGRFDCPFYNSRAGRSTKDTYMSDRGVHNALRQASPCLACVKRDGGRCELKAKKCYLFREWVHNSLIAIRKVMGINK